MSDNVYDENNGYADYSFENILENQSRIQTRQSALYEISISNIKETAFELLKKSDFDMTEKFFRYAQKSKSLRNIYFEIKDAEKRNLEKTDIANVNRKSVLDFFDCVNNEELICLSSEIKNLIALRKGEISLEYFFGEDSEAVSAEAYHKVAYLKNIYTDIAYSEIKNFISDVETVYCDNFSDMCDEVISGNCEYCIIPIENSDDGKLMGFYNLIKMYELKIELTVNVVHPDGNKSTSFALAKKNIESNSYKNCKNRTDRFFEICMASDGVSSMSELLRAAECFGMKLYKIDSAYLAYSENKFEYYVVWQINDADLYAFLIYMEIQAVRYDAIGVYEQIK